MPPTIAIIISNQSSCTQIDLIGLTCNIYNSIHVSVSARKRKKSAISRNKMRWKIQTLIYLFARGRSHTHALRQGRWKRTVHAPLKTHTRHTVFVISAKFVQCASCRCRLAAIEIFARGKSIANI